MSDQVTLAGWGRLAGSSATVVRATDTAAVAAVVRAANGHGVVARGLGRSYGDAAQVEGGTVVAPVGPDDPIELDAAASTVRVSAGTSLDRLLRYLLPRGWRLPVLPGTRFVTVGGAIASDVHGKNHHFDGSFSRWVQDLVLVDGKGQRRELSPTSDAEAFWATTGGMGLTGVITSATLSIEPATSTHLRVRASRHTSLDSVMDAMEQSPARYHVAWVDAASGSGFGRSILDEGDHVESADPELHYAPRAPRAVPPLPMNLVRPATTRAFNAAWWRRPRPEREVLVPMARFFHPLDGVADWPRLYGRAGLVQWQIVVPLSERALVERSLRALRDVGVVPSLVVLKRFGAASPAPLSFPMPGWTLAVDVAAGSPRLWHVLDRLDELVADVGGRVYLAKDVRARVATLRRMYPRLAEWQRVRDRLDPEHRFQSDLGRRLALT